MIIGKTLVHNEITSQLGKGGRGKLLRAKDQKLGRDLGSKALPEESCFPTPGWFLCRRENPRFP
jgi:hypothetical protein